MSTSQPRARSEDDAFSLGSSVSSHMALDLDDNVADLAETVNGIAFRRIVSQLAVNNNSNVVVASPQPKAKSPSSSSTSHLQENNQTEHQVSRNASLCSSDFTLQSLSPAIRNNGDFMFSETNEKRTCCAFSTNTSPQPINSTRTTTSTSSSSHGAAADAVRAAVAALATSQQADDDADVDLSASRFCRDVSPLPNLFGDMSPPAKIVSSSTATSGDIATTTAATDDNGLGSSTAAEDTDAPPPPRSASQTQRGAGSSSCSSTLKFGAASSSSTFSVADDASHLLHRESSMLVKNAIRRIATAETRHLYSSGTSLMTTKSYPCSTKQQQGKQKQESSSSNGGESIRLSSSFASVVESSEERDDDDNKELPLPQQEESSSSFSTQQQLFALQLFEAQETTARTLIEARVESCFETLFQNVFYNYTAVFMSSIASKQNNKKPPAPPLASSSSSASSQSRPSSRSTTPTTNQQSFQDMMQHYQRVKDLLECEQLVRCTIAESCGSELSIIADFFNLSLLSSPNDQHEASSSSSGSMFKTKLLEKLRVPVDKFLFLDVAATSAGVVDASSSAATSRDSSGSRPSTVKHSVSHPETPIAAANTGADADGSAAMKPEPPATSRTPTIGQQKWFRRWKV